MILQALHELAVAEGLLPDPDYELRAITYWIELAKDGRFLSFSPTRYVPASEAGKKKPREVPRSYLMPREPVRTSGAYAFFLYDKAEYVFGQEILADAAGKSRSAEDLAHRAGLFRSKVTGCFEATGDSAVRVVVEFLNRVASGEQPIDLPADCTNNDLISFRVADETVVERPAVRTWWKQQRNPGDTESSVVRCLVTGQRAAPVKNHLSLKNVPGAVSSGAPFISFNSSAFESYGFKGNENASISREAAESYGTALQRLIHPAPPNPANPALLLDRLNLRLSGDTLVCYWAPGSAFAGQVGNLLEVNLFPESPQAVRDLYTSIWAGKTVQLPDPAAFYALVLSGAQGRVVTRGFLESTVTEVQKNLARHFADLDLVRNTPKPKKGDLPPAFPLRDLLGALGGLGKSDEVPPALAEQLVQAALRGTEYPTPLLQRALLRHRAEIGRSEWTDLARRDARAALIKAVLERRRQSDSTVSYPEVKKMLDPDNTRPGYLCGRLMAITERLQQAALGDVNASVVDRYFSAASATPQAVFPRLLKNARHHARKAADGDRSGLAFVLERELDRVIDKLKAKEGFPQFLPLEEQGFFVLGYHHQRHAFFQPRDKDGASAGTSPAAATAAATAAASPSSESSVA